MPADRQSAIPHRYATQAACARHGSSVRPRALARTGNSHHAARCMHASAERRLQARSPRGARAGAGRWPFHACATCAPPGSRFPDPESVVVLQEVQKPERALFHRRRLSCKP